MLFLLHPNNELYNNIKIMNKLNVLLLNVFFLCFQAEATDLRKEVLIIGDSNTEYDYMTRPLKQMLGSATNKGYRSFSRVFAAMAASSSLVFDGTQIGTGAGKWQEKDVSTSSGASGVESPVGLALTTSEIDVSLSFGFRATSIALYYAVKPDAGSFKVIIDNKEKATVSTADVAKIIKKIVFTGLTADAHNLKVVAAGDGEISVCGVDVGAEEESRIAVHNWGNEGVTAAQFVSRIPETIFSSALQELNPTYIVILLGTNDAASTSAITFKNNLQSLVTRAQTALPEIPILILSPLAVKYSGSYDTSIQTQYRTLAYPVVAESSGIDYWDMYAFWGTFDDSVVKGWRRDDLHWNLTGGTAVAGQLSIQMGRTPLRILYRANKDKLKEDYTEASWEIFSAAMTDARTILDGYETTQEAMSNALSALSDAVNGLNLNGSELVFPDYTGNYRLDVFNLWGKCVLTATVKSSSPVLPDNQLPKGVYITRLYDGYKVIRTKKQVID
jgi:lysophospholipase L1-like esterase